MQVYFTTSLWEFVSCKSPLHIGFVKQSDPKAMKMLLQQRDKQSYLWVVSIINLVYTHEEIPCCLAKVFEALHDHRHYPGHQTGHKWGKTINIAGKI